MKKAIGILCITISLASLGWKLTQAYFFGGTTTSYINGKAVKAVALTDIGYLKVSENAVIQIKNGIVSNTTSGEFRITTPLKYQIDNAIEISASASCLLAGIVLLKKDARD
jgi:uncharacterized membrane protein YraQ (UPF0718 family)